MPRTTSPYRAMWLFVLYDLPVDDAEARKRYARFRNDVLKEGFTRLQYSVYIRYCPSEEASQAIRQRIRWMLPSEGMVTILAVTDKQFAKMESYVGKVAQQPPPSPKQLVLF